MQRKLFKSGSVALLGVLMTLSAVRVQGQVTIPDAFAFPSSAADKSKPGFIWRISQVDSVGTYTQNSNARTEAQLAGLLGPNLADPTVVGAASGPASAPNPASAPIEFVIPTVINLDKVAGSHGTFTPDDQMPGAPGTNGGTDNQAAEILAWLDLPAGDITMGVNSDDGFRMTIGGVNPRDHFAAGVGQFDGGRGAADTIFKFRVAQAGLYAARVIWENGGGDANIEWFSVQPNGTDILINDTTKPGHIKAYRTTTGPAHSYAAAFSPAPADTNVAPDASVNIVLVDGPNPIVSASVKLTLDGVAVAPAVTKTGNQTTITYKPAALLASASTHTGRLVYSDNGSPAQTTTNDWSFAVISYRNVVLPKPLYFEDFESATLGKLPAGWTSTNDTDQVTGTSDLGDPKSDAYLGWLVIDRKQVYINGTNDFHVWEAGDPDGRVSKIAPGQIENNKVLTAEDLMVGKFVYAESDERGGNQIQMLFSPDYDVSGKSDIYVSYHSSYLQNQDSLAAAEYSIDKGKTWLPIRYFLNGLNANTSQGGSRIAYTTNAQGVVSVNAVATLTKKVRLGVVDETADPTQDNDTPQVDDGAGGTRRTTWQEFIEARPLSSLGPYIEGRVNDDTVESKRVEIYRLPAADNQKTVRFRFVQAGTGSWFWGIDNFGLYSIPQTSGQPAELGQTVNGFQDDFNGATRDPNWKAFGAGGDLYQQINGVLHVNVNAGDPNHLLYVAPGYSNDVQEVLARIRITAFGSGGGPRGGIGVGVGTNSQGINLLIRNDNQTDAGTAINGRQFRLLDDLRAWGPGVKVDWTTNTWYWTRLRQEPNANAGTNDVFFKVWAADGATPEPADWQMTWNYVPTRTARTGFAGIAGSSSDGLGRFEVDYILIKAAGLPQTKVGFSPSGPPPTETKFTGITKGTGNKLQIGWIGAGVLEQANTIDGPWTTVTGASANGSITATGAGKFYRLKR